MKGLMQNQQLLVSSLLVHAEKHHGQQFVVSRRVEGDIHRQTYAQLAERSRKLASALQQHGVKAASKVATLAWNGYRHMELYYAVSGSGAILHTLNPRLFPEQLAWIINHAEDEVLCFDLTFISLIESLLPKIPTVKKFVLMADKSFMPKETKIDNLICYEDLIEQGSGDYVWPVFDENTASSLCYTSGTTGNPKGVLFSHRSTVLHSYAAALPDSLNCSSASAIMPVVPMFHVNAWGLPYIACMVGAKLVLPGAMLDGESLYNLIESEKVNLSAGVPTVWQGLLTYVESKNLKFSVMNRTIIGGSACPPAMIKKFKDTYSVDVLHAWGMTEISPMGALANPKPHHYALSEEDFLKIKSKQGRSLFGVDMQIISDKGEELPWDGVTAGNLRVRGPWVVDTYFKEQKSALSDGWFATGDIATIDKDGFMQITDRSKDVIKSGGEWISSIDLENIAVSHPSVALAACIAVKHPKWDERPLLVIIKKENANLSKEEMLKYFEGKLAKWAMPDDVAFVDSIPLGGTGKILKNKLREQFADYRLPSA